MTKITVDKALIEQALEAIELNWKSDEGDAVKPLLRAALAAPAVETMSDDLRDRLVAISAAIADEDDRAAQAMIRELLSSPPPPAEVPLLSDEEMMEMVTANAGYGGTNFDRVARAIEQAVRRKAGLK